MVESIICEGAQLGMRVCEYLRSEVVLVVSRRTRVWFS